MLRSLLLYLSRAQWAQDLINNFALARKASHRFVAGETEEEVVETVKRLNGEGLTVTIDVLGESITRIEQAVETVEAYLSLIDAIENNGLGAWVSVKLTAIGLDIDPEICAKHMRQILDRAEAAGIHATIDMEDHTYTTRTLDLLHKFHDDEGYDNVRGVIQSYLFRSDEDIARAVESGIGIRLCKGAYKEPAEVAYPAKRDVDAAFVRMSEALLSGAHIGKGYPGIATHDEKMIEAAISQVEKESIAKEAFEFQMLLGVRDGLQRDLHKQGYNVRVYVPYGDKWYGYYMRRLAERPANLWFIVSNLFRN